MHNREICGSSHHALSCAPSCTVAHIASSVGYRIELVLLVFVGGQRRLRLVYLSPGLT